MARIILLSIIFIFTCYQKDPKFIGIEPKDLNAVLEFSPEIEVQMPKVINLIF